MHEYKSLVVVAVDSGERPFLNLALRTGHDSATACTASKTFPLEEWGEVRDIIGWASHAFLQAADELSEDGWKIEHTAACTDPHVVIADA